MYSDPTLCPTTGPLSKITTAPPRYYCMLGGTLVVGIPTYFIPIVYPGLPVPLSQSVSPVRAGIIEDSYVKEYEIGRKTEDIIVPEGCKSRMTKPTQQPAVHSPKTKFTTEEALRIAKILGIDWNKSKFDVEQFRMGLDTELEHGRRDPETNVTGDDPVLTGKIALAHLKEFPDYYTRLKKLEEEAMAYWGTKRK